MPQILFAAFLLAITGPLIAQSAHHNLIPNPGFESLSGTPLGWFFTGKDFTRVMKYWESPTAASPDVYGPRVRVPGPWREKGFGLSDPHTGESCIGITLYGCGGGKPHCREYIQIQLNESLVPGQRYQFEMWCKPLPRSLLIDKLGAYFSEDRISSLTDEVLNYVPQCESEKILSPEDRKWIHFSKEFVAEEKADYLILGNFKTDEETNVLEPKDDPLNFAYYYLDDITLKKLEPILEVPVPEDDLSKIELVKGLTVELKNIYFDYDKADFLPRSFSELDKLAERLLSQTGIIIEVKGHTDNHGPDAYNEQLSIERAKAVVDYLIQKGVSEDRLKYTGFGSSMPVASNATEYGRQMNRRVEFLVLDYE